jgi:glycosyltransferase involved in cell wall biosynthesis
MLGNIPRPAVSVLLPCRNTSASLDECIDSIVSQTLRDFEVIAIDDHSTGNWIASATAKGTITFRWGEIRLQEPADALSAQRNCRTLRT